MKPERESTLEYMIRVAQNLQHRIQRLLGRAKKSYRKPGRKADGAADQKARNRTGDADPQ
ncbi:hypothetical protein DFP94_10788 [Fontibacillus phaseoli]|uniref:Uncharacterized protein n=1 Tax=Fontibacillus phaseoli TaxID=1416533 RepID=A0A369BEM7_9BACL|nr:hypothetical protein [Fontibacillus phaseoli]RCX18134.1 hypothetical protein DFP94_10788 [Fontibacillus phaseoli]